MAKEILDMTTGTISAITLARSMVQLVGTSEAILAMAAITARTDSQLKTIREAKSDETPGHLRFGPEYREFIAAARKNLGLPALPSVVANESQASPADVA